MKRFTWR